MEKLRTLRLASMVEALEEQRRDPQITDLDFEARLALLVERQWLWRSNRTLAARLQQAQLKVPATLEELDYRHPRGLHGAQIEQLRVTPWIGQHRGCLITGPQGSRSGSPLGAREQLRDTYPDPCGRKWGVRPPDRSA